jgi:tRNA (guanine9-N1)-methyltransferase
MTRLSNQSLISLTQQFAQCNATQKRFPEPFNLYVTGIGPKTKALLATRNADKWLMSFKDQHFTDIFPKNTLVYLSGDSSEDMVSYDPSSAQ